MFEAVFSLLSWLLGILLSIIPVGIVLLVALVVLPQRYRRVVETNMVHIVQRRKTTTSYGTGFKAGNVYYEWPSWMIGLGVTVVELPVSNFELSLKSYEAYDKDRVPFVVDVTAFFRIIDTNVAAQRVSNIKEMKEQLTLIVQGAVRKVLASDDIDSIMLERSKFGDSFTDEVKDQLTEWGTETVKAMELMDIRDEEGSKVIANIMAKKTSCIEMESRVEVATNMKEAKTAEIEAQQEIDIRQKEADEEVGKREAEKKKQIGIADQKSEQDIKDEKKITAQKQKDVERVEKVEEARIQKEKEVIKAEQDKEVTVTIAEGQLESKKKDAEGITAVGEAKAAVETAMKMAPVKAKIELAKEIGENEGYQNYLVAIEAIKAHIEVGGEQAKALQAASVKVIANAGSPTTGIGNVMDLFSTKGGTNLAGMIEAIAQSPMGESLFEHLGVDIPKEEIKKIKEEKPAEEEPAEDELEVVRPEEELTKALLNEPDKQFLVNIFSRAKAILEADSIDTRYLYEHLVPLMNKSVDSVTLEDFSSLFNAVDKIDLLSEEARNELMGLRKEIEDKFGA